MRIVICGAGSIGRHVAEVLGENRHNLDRIAQVMVENLVADNAVHERQARWRQEIVNRGAERPLIGHGFATGSRLLLSSQRTRSGYEWQPLHTHNAFVETYLNLGVVGLVLLTLMVGSTAIALLRVARADGVDRQQGRAAIGLLTFVLVVGLSELVIGWYFTRLLARSRISPALV